MVGAYFALIFPWVLVGPPPGKAPQRGYAIMNAPPSNMRDSFLKIGCLSGGRLGYLGEETFESQIDSFPKRYRARIKVPIFSNTSVVSPLVRQWRDRRRFRQVHFGARRAGRVSAKLTLCWRFGAP
jgi:hypothetical protein